MVPRHLLGILLLTFLYYLFGKFSLLVTSENQIITISIFAAEGISLAAVLLFGRHLWLGVFTGQLLLALDQGVSLWGSLGVALVNSLEVLIAWGAFYALGLDRRLETLRDVAGLFVIILLIAAPFSALFGVAVLYNTTDGIEGEYGLSLFSWWFGNSMGQLLWTPSLLLLYDRWKEVAWLPTLTYVILFGMLIYMLLFASVIHYFALILLITIFLSIFITLIHDMVTGVLFVLVLSSISQLSVLYHTGIFVSAGMLENIINLNFYILAHILLVWIIGTLYHENLRNKEDLEILNSTLTEKMQKQAHTLEKQHRMMAHQAKMASMGEMLSLIAHQWRQPLNRINSNVAVIDTVIQEEEPDYKFLQQKIGNIKNQTRFMSDTIDDFANFFHPNKQKSPFMPELVLKKAVKLIENRMQNIRLEWDVEENAWVESYEREFLQVVLSVLNNAIDNFQARKVREPSIKIVLRKGENEIFIGIHDNGGGIRTERVEQVFEPYFTTNSTNKGTGLGLYMAKLLLEESMQGRLNVVNEEKGAFFSIVLPIGVYHE
jgi:signal transduction histidine kinase